VVDGMRRVKGTPRASLPAPTTARQPIQAGGNGATSPATPPVLRTPPRRTEHTHTLVLLRHGESIWNREKRFTGWCDVPLTAEGEEEAMEAGKILGMRGFTFDIAFTSELVRAHRTCDLVLKSASLPSTKCVRSWQLNERHYGDLQGQGKEDPIMLETYGEDNVFEWRKSYTVPPPPMGPSHPYWAPPPAPLTESLFDCQERVLKYFREEITPRMHNGSQVLIVAHANTIRALVKVLDSISDENIRGLRIPNSIPLVYKLDENMLPVGEKDDWGFQGEYVISAGTHERLVAVERSQRRVLTALFKALDQNENGSISLGELETGLEKLNWDLTPRTKKLLDQIADRFLLDSDSDIDIEEFIDLARTFWKQQDHFRFVDPRAVPVDKGLYKGASSFQDPEPKPGKGVTKYPVKEGYCETTEFELLRK